MRQQSFSFGESLTSTIIRQRGDLLSYQLALLIGAGHFINLIGTCFLFKWSSLIRKGREILCMSVVYATANFHKSVLNKTSSEPQLLPDKERWGDWKNSSLYWCVLGFLSCLLQWSIYRKQTIMKRKVPLDTTKTASALDEKWTSKLMSEIRIQIQNTFLDSNPTP